MNVSKCQIKLKNLDKSDYLKHYEQNIEDEYFLHVKMYYYKQLLNF